MSDKIVVGRPRVSLAHKAPEKKHDGGDETLSAKEYMRQLNKKFKNVLRVTAVFDPLVGDRPWIYTEDGELTGVFVELIKAMAKHIPGVEKVVVYPKESVEDALEAVVIGGDGDAVLALNVPITRSAQLSDIGFIATDSAICETQTLVFLPSFDNCSVFQTLSGVPANNALTALEAAFLTCPDLTFAVSANNAVGLALLRTIGVTPDSSRLRLFPTISDAESLALVVNSPNVVALLPCPVSNNIPSNFSTLTLSSVNQTVVLERLVYRPSVVPCSIGAAVSGSPNDPLAGVHSTNSNSTPLVIGVFPNDSNAITTLNTIRTIQSVVVFDYPYSSLSVANLNNLPINASVLVSAGSIPNLNTFLSNASAAGYAVLSLPANFPQVTYLIYRLSTAPGSLNETLDLLEALDRASFGVLCPNLTFGVNATDAAAKALAAQYPNLPVTDLPASALATGPALATYVNTYPGTAFLLSFPTTSPINLPFGSTFNTLVNAGVGMTLVSSTTTTNTYLLYSLAGANSPCTPTTILFENLAKTPGTCALAVAVSFEDLAGQKLLADAGVSAVVFPEPLTTWSAFVSTIIPQSPLGDQLGALVPVGLSLPADGGSPRGPLVAVDITATIPFDFALFGLGIGIYRPAFCLELQLQYIFDLLVCNGTYRRILRRFGLTSGSAPEGTLIPPVNIPPRFYSITKGFIPQVAAYECCCELKDTCDDTCVEVVLGTCSQ